MLFGRWTMQICMCVIRWWTLRAPFDAKKRGSGSHEVQTNGKSADLVVVETVKANGACVRFDLPLVDDVAGPGVADAGGKVAFAVIRRLGEGDGG